MACPEIGLLQIAAGAQNRETWSWNSVTDGALGLGVSRCGLKVQLLPEISGGIIGVVPF